MYRQHRLREIGLRRGVSRDKNGLRRGLAGLNRTWTFDPCTPCLKFCTPTYKILPNSLMLLRYIGPNNMHVTCVHRYWSDIMLFWFHGWDYGRKKLPGKAKCPNYSSTCSKLYDLTIISCQYYWTSGHIFCELNYFLTGRVSHLEKMVAILIFCVARVLFEKSSP